MKNIPTRLLVVALALVSEERRLLMHKRPPGKHHAGLWEFPGGKVEAAEMPASALVREIEEELGIVISEASLEPIGFAESAVDSPAPPIVILLYRSRAWIGEPRSLEGGESCWFALEEARSLPKPPLDVALFERLTQIGI